MLLPTDKTLRMTDAVVWLRPGEGALGLAGAAGVHLQQIKRLLMSCSQPVHPVPAPRVQHIGEH